MRAYIRHMAPALAAVLALACILTGCKAVNMKNRDDTPKTPESPANDTQEPSLPDWVDTLPTEPETPKEPERYVYTYKEWPEEELTAYTGTVEHLSFHQVIAYPELAFDGDELEKEFDNGMVTVGEFKKILQSLYDNGYILISMNDVWTEYTTEQGVQSMRRNTLLLPRGKKPLIISVDDPCYYEKYIGNGFMEKLVQGEDGQIWAWGHDPQGSEVTSQDLDLIPILDKFVAEHPDFSFNGAKGCLVLTGYEGIFGYRTNSYTTGMTEEQEAARLEQIEAVKPIVEQLKATGWYFGCHTWGHIRLDSSGRTVEAVARDMERWQSDVGDIIGPTRLFFYPDGGRPDGDDWHTTGEIFKYLQGLGYRVFASLGTESFSFIKTDICAVICDRLHPDGPTLRYHRELYLPFYDAAEILDTSVRPDYGYDFG